LRALPSTQPATKIGQVIWAWAEIEAGLAAGMKLKEVWEAASLDGLEMSYAQFRVYISRLRRRRQRTAAISQQPPPPVANSEPGLSVPPPADPFRNLREQRERKKQALFEYDPFSIGKMSSTERGVAKTGSPASVRKFEYPAGPPDESKLI
jgi:hypothetical protein